MSIEKRADPQQTSPGNDKGVDLMITQKQMKEWIPEAVEQFKAAMPPIDVPYPEIHIASDKTALRIREEIVSRLHSPQKNPGKASAMEPSMAKQETPSSFTKTM